MLRIEVSAGRLPTGRPAVRHRVQRRGMTDRVDRPRPSVLVVEDEPDLRQADRRRPRGRRLRRRPGPGRRRRDRAAARLCLRRPRRRPAAAGRRRHGRARRSAHPLPRHPRRSSSPASAASTRRSPAIKRGAVDFLIKPFQLAQLVAACCAPAIEQRQLRQENAELRAQLHEPVPLRQHHRRQPADAAACSRRSSWSRR